MLVAGGLCFASLAIPAFPQGAPATRGPGVVANVWAGVTSVEGPGLIVTLKDSAQDVPAESDRDHLRVHEQDLLGVINSLKAGGCEAMAISSLRGKWYRITFTTAFRDDDNGIRVNATVLKGPIRIAAIGDPKQMKAELFRRGGVVRRSGLEALKMITVTTERTIRLPAAPVDRQPRFARPSPRVAEPRRVDSDDN